MDWTNQDQWNNRSKQERMSEHVEMLQLSKKWTTARMVGKSVVKYSHWFSVRDSEGKKVRFPKPCHGAFIADDGKVQINAKKCPYCSICETEPTAEVFVNVIARAEQKNEPRRKGKPTRYERKKQKLAEGVAFYKESKDTEMWTPMRGLRVTTSLGRKISELASLNTRKIDGVKQSFGPDHPKYGFNLLIRYDENAASPNDMYSAQKGELTKLTPEELEYLRWHFPMEIAESRAEAIKEANNLKPRMIDAKGKPVFPELANEASGKKKKKGDHGKYRDQFDDDDDAEDDDDDRRSSKKSKSKKGRDEDEDDDDDFDDGIDEDGEEDDDDDDDDRSSKKSKKSKSQKSRDDDDDDDDRRSSKKSKKSSKKRRDDDDDDADEEEDDDDYDDDEDEGDDDDDDDDDDRRSSKKSKKSKSKKSSKRRSRDDEDDDDDEIPF